MANYDHLLGGLFGKVCHLYFKILDKFIHKNSNNTREKSHSILEYIPTDNLYIAGVKYHLGAKEK